MTSWVTSMAGAGRVDGGRRLGAGCDPGRSLITASNGTVELPWINVAMNLPGKRGLEEREEESGTECGRGKSRVTLMTRADTRGCPKSQRADGKRRSGVAGAQKSPDSLHNAPHTLGTAHPYKPQAQTLLERQESVSEGQGTGEEGGLQVRPGKVPVVPR